METLLIQINNNKARKLLEDLQDLKLIKFVNNKVAPKAKNKLSDFAGIITKKEALELAKQVKKEREKWD